jgi:hypothetical protein
MNIAKGGDQETLVVGEPTRAAEGGSLGSGRKILRKKEIEHYED